MRRAASIAPPWTRRILWPARSWATVFFYPGEERGVKRAVRRMFERPLRPWEYAGLVGAPDGARVDVGTYRGGLYLDTSDPVAARFRTIFLVRRAGADLVIVNEGFHIHVGGMRNRGLGLRIFHRQLQNAKVLGVHHIEATAGRGADENGYYTWPRFGFDGPLSGQVKKNLPQTLERARKVLDLMVCEKGRRWWREYGSTIRVAFDVSERSRSRRVFEQYVRNRMKHDRRGNRAGDRCHTASGPGGQKEDLKIGPGFRIVVLDDDARGITVEREEGGAA